MTKTITIQNPNNPNESWTSGNRGKPPKFVTTHPDYIAFKEQKAIEVPKDTPVAVGPVTDARLKFWKFIGLNCAEDEVKTKLSVNCYVAAHSRSEAIRELNKSLKSPLLPSELEKMWALIEPNEFMPQVVGTYELKGESWIKR
jgi:hypothetical protein